MDIDNAVREFEQLATIDYVGFWELFRVVNDDLEHEAPEKVRPLVLELVRKLLSRRFLAGEFTGTGKGVVPWPDQNPDSVIRHIETEWDKLERQINIGDICWFIGPK